MTAVCFSPYRSGGHRPPLQLLRAARRQMRRLPIHRHTNAGPAARVIEENKFFHRRRVQLAIGAELERNLRHTVRFPRSIEPEDVGLGFRHPGHSITERRGEKRIEGENESNHRESRGISYATNTPGGAALSQQRAKAETNKAKPH